MSSKRRAHSLEEFFPKIAGLQSKESAAHARTFLPRSDDILIATFPKSGTTWIQQICHGLRTSGDMTFDEITFVVPWIEMAHDLGLDSNAEQVANPRCFKSHDTWEDIAKGARYIYVVRNPYDVAISMFNFMDGWFIEPGTVALEEFIPAFFAANYRERGYWRHLLSWWAQKDNPDVLFCAYENMKVDLPGTVKRIAEFMGITDLEVIKIATEQASYEFMNANNRQFDDHIVSEAKNDALGLPPYAMSTKVRKGVSQTATLNDELRVLLDKIWEEIIEAKLGFSDYDALLKAL